MVKKINQWFHEQVLKLQKFRFHNSSWMLSITVGAPIERASSIISSPLFEFSSIWERVVLESAVYCKIFSRCDPFHGHWYTDNESNDSMLYLYHLARVRAKQVYIEGCSKVAYCM